MSALIWDTILDNLKLHLHALPAFVDHWQSLEDFHLYAAEALPQDLAAFHRGERPGEILHKLAEFFRAHYHGTELNYQAMLAVGANAVESWHRIFRDDAASGDAERGFTFRHGSWFESAYRLSTTAHIMLNCPVDAPTVQVRPALYVDQPNANARFRKASRIIEKLLSELRSGVSSQRHPRLLARLNTLPAAIRFVNASKAGLKNARRRSKRLNLTSLSWRKKSNRLKAS